MLKFPLEMFESVCKICTQNEHKHELFWILSATQHSFGYSHTTDENGFERSLAAYKRPSSEGVAEMM